MVEQEEEQRMRRVASNIAKDVKKFWLKVDKLVRNRSLQPGSRYEHVGSDRFDVCIVFLSWWKVEMGRMWRVWDVCGPQCVM